MLCRLGFWALFAIALLVAWGGGGGDADGYGAAGSYRYCVSGKEGHLAIDEREATFHLPEATVYLRLGFISPFFLFSS